VPRRRPGNPFAVLDGTLIRTDRVAADRPFFSGKHHCHGMNLQVISGPAGQLLWVSGALPGSVHDRKAAWTWGIEDELAAAGLPALADKGYQGAAHAKTPYKGKNKPESQKDANRAHAKLRAPGERANAQLKAWKILTRLRCCPWRAGQIAKAILVLQIYEVKAG
jgi:DDE superfamily endonuclease